MSDFQAKTLVCQECGREFFWDGYEPEPPKLCPICRGKKKAEEKQFDRGVPDK